MKQLSRILVGHDLKAGGEVALKSAAAIAQCCAAALRVVHVAEPLEPYQRLAHPLTPPYTVDEIVRRTGEQLKTLLTGGEFAGLEADYEVRLGKPFFELILAQRAWLADLIVVGGPSVPEEPFSASTSDRLVRKGDAPVLVAKIPLRADAKTLLVATDFSAPAREAAEAALRLAEKFDARIVFLHVLDRPSYTVRYVQEWSVSVPAPPPAPEELEPEWEAFLSGLPLDRIDCEKIAVSGDAAQVIVAQANEQKADMLIMGTHGRSGLPYMLLGSVAEKVLRSARLPLLAVKSASFQFQMP
jgi:nucleotide-binding universal stress UspA family protein